MCVCQQLEKASSNSSGKELCIFLDKLLRFYPPKRSARATFRLTPETMKIVFHRLVFSFISFCEGKLSLYKLASC